MSVMWVLCELFGRYRNPDNVNKKGLPYLSDQDNIQATVSRVVYVEPIELTP